MPDRRLGPEERAAWARLRATVRPLLSVTGAVEPVVIPPPPPARALAPSVTGAAKPAPPRQPAATLDGGWDRRLARGAVQPDRTVDLHGHNLAAAHARLDLELDRAVALGERVLLLVTGRPPRAGSERPHARGAIRASIGDWLALSRHARVIAAVRGAHPRHGGAGALYVILRRPR